MEIEVVYCTLAELGLVRSQVEFSRVWLGRSARYYSSMLAGKHQPSVGTLSALRFRIANARDFTKDAVLALALTNLLEQVEIEMAKRIVCDPFRQRARPLH